MTADVQALLDDVNNELAAVEALQTILSTLHDTLTSLQAALVAAGSN